LDDFKRCSLLIIDDFGTNRTTGWTDEILYSIVNFRYENKLPLIITTNLSIDKFKESNDERLMSRIFEMCKGIKFSGPDYRLEISKSKNMDQRLKDIEENMKK